MDCMVYLPSLMGDPAQLDLPPSLHVAPEQTGEGSVFPSLYLRNLGRISDTGFRGSEHTEGWLESSVIRFNAHPTNKNRPSSVKHPALTF